MESLMIKKIPYVDAEQLLNGNIAPESFLNTLHENGFVYLYNLDFEPLGLNAPQFKKLEHVANNFFDLSLDDKMKYYIGNSPNHRGYVPVKEKGEYHDEKNRVYEAFDMSYSTSTIKYPQKLMGENVWPQDVQNFKQVCSDYYNKMFFLGRSILSILAQSFNLPIDHFDELSKNPPAQLRLLNYVSNELLDEAEDVAMGCHTDYECFTFIYQSIPGIQGLWW